MVYFDSVTTKVWIDRLTMYQGGQGKLKLECSQRRKKEKKGTTQRSHLKGNQTASVSDVTNECHWRDGHIARAYTLAWGVYDRLLPVAVLLGKGITKIKKRSKCKNRKAIQVLIATCRIHETLDMEGALVKTHSFRSSLYFRVAFPFPLRIPPPS